MAMSFLVFQIVQSAPTQMMSVTLRLAPLQSSANSNKKSEQLVGDLVQPKETLKKDQRKIASGHWKRIWSVVSGMSQATQFSGPDHCFFFN